MRRPTILMPTWTTIAAEGLFRVQATDAACIEAIAAAGGEVVLVPLRSPFAGEDALELVLQRVLSCDGLFIPGSTADVNPRYYAQRPHPHTSLSHALLDWWVMVMTLVSRGAGTPVLGVCGGAQRMSVALGGTLLQDLPGHRAWICTRWPVASWENLALGLRPLACLRRKSPRGLACIIKRLPPSRRVRSSGREPGA